MGTIYKVRHRLLDEIRVVKVMRPHAASDPDLRRRFREEARIATRLKHPNICAIHDFAVEDGGRAYLVMEYVDGLNLAEFMSSLGLPGVPLTLEIAHQALLALSYLHRKGVVHRDVAPDNLLLTYDEDGRPAVKLIDLGIAKVLDREAETTAAGVLMGKPRYSSPEQLGILPPGERLDGRSDLYSLGVVLYELLTGQSPFEGRSTTELLKARRVNSIIPLEESDVQGRVPPDLRAVVLRALERKREDRFATADEFDRAIVSLQRRYAGQKPIEISPAMLETARLQQPASGAVTPGAQDRLDRQFAHRPTPPHSPAPELSPVSPTSLPGDPLHTIRLPVEKRAAPAPPPALDGFELMTNGSAGDVELSPPSAPLPPSSAGRERTPERKRNVDLRSPDMGTPLKQVPARRGGRVLSAAGFALAALALFLVWRSWPSRTGTEPPVALARPEPVATARIEPDAATPVAGDSHAAGGAASSSTLEPSSALGSSSTAGPAPATGSPSTPAQSSAPEPSPGAEPQAPVEQQSAVTTPSSASAPAPSAPTSAAGSSSPVPASPGSQSPHRPEAESTGALRALADKTAAARRGAEAARGQDFAPSTFRRGVAKQASADRLAAAGSSRQAEALYREASALFDFAAAAGTQRRASAARPQAGTLPPVAPPPADRATAAPSQKVEAEPPATAAPAERPAPEAPAGSPSERRTADAPAETEDQAQSRQRIRQVVADYAWARRTRNAGLLAQVFPSDRARFAQDSKAASLPTVTLDVESIDFESENHAVVGVQELVVPADQPIGNTPAWAATVLELERRGGRWFIMRRRTL